MQGDVQREDGHLLLGRGREPCGSDGQTGLDEGHNGARLVAAQLDCGRHCPAGCRGAGGDRDRGAEGGEVGLRGRPVGRGGLGVRRGRGRRAHDQALQGQAWGGRLAWGKNHWIVPEQRSGQRQAGAKSERHLRARDVRLGALQGQQELSQMILSHQGEEEKHCTLFFGYKRRFLVALQVLWVHRMVERHHRLFVRVPPHRFPHVEGILLRAVIP
mmetsp:Transcript_7705/g.27948  ORF Transcript_7705/g.27948 Transcript_7705/m.27948 type:complete len:215 (-) Transcript_7705:585-1229(-)